MEEEKKPTTLGARFSGFAAGHFCLSLCGAAVAYLAARLLINSTALCAVGAAVLMLAYFPAGAMVASENHWTRPENEKEQFLAVLQPALVAWAWAAVVLVTLLRGGLPDWMWVVVPVTLILAFPSSAFVILCAVLGSNVDLYPNLYLWWGRVAFLAGLLPPLLFALGSFWQSGREEKEGLGVQQAEG